jgi:hypothetical protein
MLKKFGYSLIVAGVLMLGVGVVNAVSVSTAVATEAKEVKCEKCGDLPSKPAENCKCECHIPAPKK